jgi:putative ABC transport system permease protein
MHLGESLRMAVKTLTANKLRSTLTMLGIIIGNASVIAMVGIGEGAQSFVAGEIESLGPNLLFVIPGNQEAQRSSFNMPKTLVLEDAEAIATQVPSVQGIAPEFNDRGLVVFRNRNANATIIGTTPGFPQVRSFTVASGSFFTDLDMQRSTQVVVLGSELANRLFRGTDPIGQQVRVNNISFEVIGVLQEKGAGLGGVNYDEAVLMPLITMSRRLVGQTSPFGIELTYIVASINSEDNMRAAQFQIENLLRLRHKIVGEDDFTVRSQKDLLEFTGTITGALTAMLAAIAGISLLVGGIGIMNIMLVSVRERTQEIGLRKAIGASGQDILVQFMIEAVILSAVGGILGTGIGVGGAILIGNLAPFEPGVSVAAIVTSVCVSGGIGLFFGVVPARQAAKLDPIVALRSA